ncbi:hypothetical protein FRC11_002373, partial [Ceratobasidium sp. 423]
VVTAESTNPRSSDSVCSTVTPISTLQLDDTLARVSRPRKVHGKFSYVREREERERRSREAKCAFRPLLPPILPAPLGRYPGGVKNGGPYVLRRLLVDVPSKLIQTTTFTPSGGFVDKSFVKPDNPPTPLVPSASAQTATHIPIQSESDILSNPPTPTPTPTPEPASEPAPIIDTATEQAVDVAEAAEPATASSEPTPVPAEFAPAPVEPTSPAPPEPSPTEPAVAAEPSVAVADSQVPPEPTPVPTSTGPAPLPADEPTLAPNQPIPAILTQETPTPAIPETNTAPADDAPAPTEPGPPAPAETPTPTGTPDTAESALPVPPGSVHPTPTAPTVPTPSILQPPSPNTQTTAIVPARAPNEAARPDATVTYTTQGSICSLVQLLGQLSIHEIVEHEMEDWSGLVEMDVDARPTVDTAMEMLKELELGMWDSIEEMERWRTGGDKAPTGTLDVRDTIMSSPRPPTSPMVLDASEVLDTVMESPTNPREDAMMDTDSTWADVTPPQPS